MREHRDAAGAMNEVDRVAHGKTVLADVRRLAVAQIALERIAEIHRPSLGDQRTRDVRTANRAAGRLLEDRRERDAHTEIVQLGDDSLSAGATHLAQRDEL